MYNNVWFYCISIIYFYNLIIFFVLGFDFCPSQVPKIKVLSFKHFQPLRRWNLQMFDQISYKDLWLLCCCITYGFTYLSVILLS